MAQDMFTVYQAAEQIYAMVIGRGADYQGIAGTHQVGNVSENLKFQSGFLFNAAKCIQISVISAA